MEVERRTRIGEADDATRACDGIGDVPRCYRLGIFLGDMGRPPLRRRGRRDAINLVVGLRRRRWLLEKLGVGECAGAVAGMRSDPEIRPYPSEALRMRLTTRQRASLFGVADY
jgi:hypothetical protein